MWPSHTSCYSLKYCKYVRKLKREKWNRPITFSWRRKAKPPYFATTITYTYHVIYSIRVSVSIKLVMMGLQGSRLFFIQLEVKPKPSMTCSYVFPRFALTIRFFTSSFDWFIGLCPLWFARVIRVSFRVRKCRIQSIFTVRWLISLLDLYSVV